MQVLILSDQSKLALVDPEFIRRINALFKPLSRINLDPSVVADKIALNNARWILSKAFGIDPAAVYSFEESKIELLPLTVGALPMPPSGHDTS